MKRFHILIVAIGILFPVASFACTSVIIPGWATPDGRPLLWKHRDTGTLDNRLEHFNGETYNFIGLVNSEEGPLGREVWIGSNTAGFSIMNTASYCLKDDDVPAADMDREGVLMYRALEICATLSDFEHFLDTLSRPMGVEANFGCIDAFGGAAYYETSNSGYVKRDVNEMKEGYCVVTNFSVTGRKEDWKGVERYCTAVDIFSEMNMNGGVFEKIDPEVIMNSLSRSYRHQGDSLYIPRYITSASVVVHGVKAGEDPAGTVFWAALGYPATAVMVPVPVSDRDHIPSAMKKGKGSDCSLLCGLSLELKNELFPEGKEGYFDISLAERYSELFGKLEIPLSKAFNELYSDFIDGRISYRKYLKSYERLSEKHIKKIITYHK